MRLMARTLEEIEEIVQYTRKHGYNKAVENFKPISKKTIAKYMRSWRTRYYQPRNYENVSDELLDEWHNLYFMRLAKTGFNPLNMGDKQEKWLLEMKAIEEESEKRGTWHEKAIKKLLENQMKKFSPE